MLSRNAIMARERRAEWIASKGGACERCGSSEHLQMHHRDKDQKESHAVWGWRKERRDAELAKCDLLCRKCHIEHHNQERIRHGICRFQTGCRCEVCRAAYRKFRRAVYRRQKARRPVGKITHSQRWQLERKAAGICIRCGASHSTGMWLCRVCQDKKNARDPRYKRRGTIRHA